MAVLVTVAGFLTNEVPMLFRAADVAGVGLTGTAALDTANDLRGGGAKLLRITPGLDAVAVDVVAVSFAGNGSGFNAAASAERRRVTTELPIDACSFCTHS
jgi:hypothetical protein